MRSCYCKIVKKLEKLEKEIQNITPGDNTLVQQIQEIRQDLDLNTQNDEVLRELVHNIEIAGTEASEGLIDSLFP